MKTLVVVIIALFLNNLALGQKDNKDDLPLLPLSKKELEIDKRNNSCIRKSHTSFSERLRNYPFNSTSQIQLVSFRGGVDSMDKDIFYDSLPRLNDTVCYSKLIEIKTLTYLQVDTLTNLLYNYGFYKIVKGPHIGSISQCHFPRNAILFLNTAGKVIDFIEICFECRRVKTSSQKISLGDMCDQKLEMLKAFFKNIGIDYGITEGVMGES